MKINSSPTREKYPLHPRKIWKKTIGSLLGLLLAIVIFVLFLTPTLFADEAIRDAAIGIVSSTLPFFLVAICAVAVLTYLYQVWYFAFYYYDLTDQYVVIKKNPITPKEIVFPYERIQDVNVDQDVLDRLFGLYDIHLSTATSSSGQHAHIDGVDKQVADSLRSHLLDIVRQRVIKGGTPHQDDVQLAS